MNNRKIFWLIAAIFISGGVVQSASAAPKRSKAKAAASVASSDDGEENGGKSEVPVGCKAQLLIDHGTAEPVVEINAHEPLRPASMVKLMTAYVVLKKLEEGQIREDEMVTASAKASKIGGSQVYLREGEQFTVQQLLETVMIQSANDAAVALAEHIAGDTSAFVDQMNEVAKDLGMKESEFHYPHGLPPEAGQKPDLVSAYDFGLLARALIDNFPQIIEMTSKIEQPFRNGEFIMRNHNKLVIHYPGCDGLKTGFYNLAGFGVVATAKKNNERMTAVIMGCDSRKFRDAEAAKLLSKGFAQFKSVRLAKKGETLTGRIAVAGGQKVDAQAIANQEVRATVRAGEEGKVTQRAKYCTNLTAPVKLGAPCGTVEFLIGERVVASVDTTVGEDVEPASGVQKLLNFFKR